MPTASSSDPRLAAGTDGKGLVLWQLPNSSQVWSVVEQFWSISTVYDFNPMPGDQSSGGQTPSDQLSTVMKRPQWSSGDQLSSGQTRPVVKRPRTVIASQSVNPQNTEYFKCISNTLFQVLVFQLL